MDDIVSDPVDPQPTQLAPSLQPKQAQTGSSVGNLASDFTVTSIDGKQISLSDSRENEKPVLVYFFASWCPYCRNDLTAVRDVYPKYTDKVDFLIIDLDVSESSSKIKKYRDVHNYVGDFASGSQKILVDYSVLSTTTKFAIDKDGIILWRGSGEIGSADWDRLFSSLTDL